jgi:hypothetical protein
MDSHLSKLAVIVNYGSLTPFEAWLASMAFAVVGALHGIERQVV